MDTRKKDDEKQRNIKNAVVRLILKEGFQGASIAKIAQSAGVSPATVYIYYDSKEDMLQDIYRECIDDAVHFLMGCIRPDMSAQEIVAQLVRQYYRYIVQNQEVFCFLEQFDTCPALYNSCQTMRGSACLTRLLAQLQQKHIFGHFDTDNLYAILFPPVERIACHSEAGEEPEDRLDELIKMIQKALM